MLLVTLSIGVLAVAGLLNRRAKYKGNLGSGKKHAQRQSEIKTRSYLSSGNENRKNISSAGKVEKILMEMSGEKAIIAIDNLLTPTFYSNPEKLSEEEKTIVYIEELEREVNNGGFSQFFYNSAGDFTEEVIQSLRNIGSIRFLALVESAKAQFPNSYVPKDRTKRQEILKVIEKIAAPVWNNLNIQFYKYEEDIYSLMRTYMLNNISKFR